MYLVGTGIKDASGKEITIGIEGTYNPYNKDKILKDNQAMIIYALTGQVPGLYYGQTNPITGERLEIPNDLSKVTASMVNNTGIPVFKLENGTLTKIENNAADVSNWGKYDYMVKATEKPKLNLDAFNTGFGDAHPILTEKAQQYGFNKVTASEGQKFASRYAAPQYTMDDPRWAGDFEGGGYTRTASDRTGYRPKNEVELQAGKDAGIIPKGSTLEEAQKSADDFTAGVARTDVPRYDQSKGAVVDKDGNVVRTTGTAGTPGAVTTTGAGAITAQNMPFGGINPLQAFADQTPATAAEFAMGTGALPGYANPYLQSAYRRIYPGLAGAYNMALQTGRLVAPTIGTSVAGAPIQAPGVGFAQFTQGAGGNIAQGIEQDLQTIANVKAKVAAAGGAYNTLTQQELIVYQQLLADPAAEYKLRGELIDITSPNRATRQARQTLLDQQYSMGQLTAPGAGVNYGMMGTMTAPPVSSPTQLVNTSSPVNNFVAPQWGPDPTLTKVIPTHTPAVSPAVSPAVNTAANATNTATPPNLNTNFNPNTADKRLLDEEWPNPVYPGFYDDRTNTSEINMSATGKAPVIDVLNAITNEGAATTGGINMNTVDVGVQQYPGRGANPSEIDEKYSVAVLKDAAGNKEKLDIINARGEKVFFTENVVDPITGSQIPKNKFTFINSNELAQLAAAQAQATGTPWYSTVYVTDPITGRRIGMKKGSQHLGVNDWTLQNIDGSSVSLTDQSPQPVAPPVLNPGMTWDRFQKVMAGDKDWSQGLPTHTGVQHDTSVQDAWNEMQKKIAKAKSFSELMGVKDEIKDPVKKKIDDDEKEQQAFARFIYEGF